MLRSHVSFQDFLILPCLANFLIFLQVVTKLNAL